MATLMKASMRRQCGSAQQLLQPREHDDQCVGPTASHRLFQHVEDISQHRTDPKPSTTSGDNPRQTLSVLVNYALPTRSVSLGKLYFSTFSTALVGKA